jgi:predicted MFS family arabinose efflux permease
MNVMLWVAIINFCALPWTSAHAFSAAVSLAIWGICGWGLIVPQQHRLVQLRPGGAPLLLALNNTATYIGLACSGVLGGAVLQSIGGQYLSLVAAALIGIAFLSAEAAHHRIRLSRTQHRATSNREAEAV